MKSRGQSQHKQEPTGLKEQRSARRKWRKEEFKFGSQNVRTLNGRRSAIVALAIEKDKYDVVALAETRLVGVGEIQEGTVVIHYSGNAAGSPQQGKGGVGIALSARASKLLVGKPEVVSPRVMVAQFQNGLTFISVYAPTHSSKEQRLTQKASFYEDLQTAVDRAPRGNVVVIAGDFNARVGSSPAVYIEAGVAGRHGVGVRNSSGDQLLNFCLKNRLCVTNTFFSHPDRHKYTWQHPRSKKWHVLDYVLITRAHLRKVRDTRVYPGVDCWSDHRFVGSSINVAPPPKAKAAS